MWETFFFILLGSGELILKDYPPVRLNDAVVQECAQRADIKDYRDKGEMSDPLKELTMLDCVYHYTDLY